MLGACNSSSAFACSVFVYVCVWTFYTHNNNNIISICAHMYMYIGDVGGYTRAMTCGHGFQKFYSLTLHRCD